MGKKRFIAVHHSATPRENTTVAGITAAHKRKGWPHIGYHRVIGQDGTIAYTLALEEDGFHVWGRNKDTIGICVVGNFEQEYPIRAQIENLEKELLSLCQKLGLSASKIYGHKEVSLPFHGTACPGKNLFSLLPGIKKKVGEKLTQNAAVSANSESNAKETDPENNWGKLIEMMKAFLGGGQ
jgi:hypothetical protein